MKKVIWIVVGFLVVVLWIGCGAEPDSKKSEEAPDQIEKVGNAASTLGYDGASLSFLFIEGFGGHYASNAFKFQDKPDLINTR